MSRYEYRYETSNERLDIKTSADPRNVFMWVHEGRNQAAILVPNADVPTVAAELLKASVSDWSTQPVELVAIVASLERYVKAHDPKVKLQERRDAVALSLSGLASYTQQVQTTRKAIDRIIELEDGASRD